MAYVYIDRENSGIIRVCVQRGAKPGKVALFTDRAEAEAFALSCMGKRGMIVSSLDVPAKVTQAAPDPTAS